MGRGYRIMVRWQAFYIYASYNSYIIVITVKWLKSVCIYGSYRKIKPGVPLFGPPCMHHLISAQFFAASPKACSIQTFSNLSKKTAISLLVP